MLAPRVFKELRKPEGYPTKLETLGDHIRAVRLERGEYQKDVASRVGVGLETILHWELGQTEVTLQHYPAVADYLGYCLVPDSETDPSLGTLVRRHRFYRGLSLKKAAQAIGVDPGTLSKWESGASTPSAKYQSKLRTFCTAKGKARSNQ